MQVKKPTQSPSNPGLEYNQSPCIFQVVARVTGYWNIQHLMWNVSCWTHHFSGWTTENIFLPSYLARAVKRLSFVSGMDFCWNEVIDILYFFSVLIVDCWLYWQIIDKTTNLFEKRSNKKVVLNYGPSMKLNERTSPKNTN